ncbi:MAG: hypothetical protein L0Y62_03005 [Nitrospirae bacterium]|nr:hypothetical protein [Nitrospirota bacterium]
MKRKILLFTSLLFLLSGAALSQADTILFPVITVNYPSVVTIVSVTNAPGATSSHLHYIYRYKSAQNTDGTPNLEGTCSSQGFSQTTFDGDIVSFDPSGYLNSGNAMYWDTNSYSGAFTMAGTGARRAYLLVTNSNSSGTRVNVSNNLDLGGEAILMDIAYGAAWGYRAVNDNTREDYTFISKDAGGGVYSSLPAQGYNYRQFAFLPYNIWTTRFFVTGLASDMHTANASVSVNLRSASSEEGVFDRNGVRYTFSPISKSITCTGAVDLRDLIDATTWSAVESKGGWTWFRVSTGDAIVYKLEYLVNNPTYGGTNNNGYLLSTYERP